MKFESKHVLFVVLLLVVAFYVYKKYKTGALTLP